jgi:hypothetical protein
MAMIRSFQKVNPRPGGRHRSTDCGYRWFDLDGERILQLDTYGSNERQDVGTVSQSIQVDRERAAELKKVLEQAFPGI